MLERQRRNPERDEDAEREREYARIREEAEREVRAIVRNEGLLGLWHEVNERGGLAEWAVHRENPRPKTLWIGVAFDLYRDAMNAAVLADSIERDRRAAVLAARTQVALTRPFLGE